MTVWNDSQNNNSLQNDTRLIDNQLNDNQYNNSLKNDSIGMIAYIMILCGMAFGLSTISRMTISTITL
jgi:hypothetical protein